MVLGLMLVGLVLAGLSLWQVSRLLGEAERAPARLDALVDELVATAEATTATVADRAEALSSLLVAADERIAALRGTTAAPAATIAPVGASASTVAPALTGASRSPLAVLPPVERAPSLGEVIAARAAAGQDEGTIARELGLARTAVRLALQTKRRGGER